MALLAQTCLLRSVSPEALLPKTFTARRMFTPLCPQAPLVLSEPFSVTQLSCLHSVQSAFVTCSRLALQTLLSLSTSGCPASPTTLLQCRSAQVRLRRLPPSRSRPWRSSASKHLCAPLHTGKLLTATCWQTSHSSDRLSTTSFFTAFVFRKMLKSSAVPVPVKTSLVLPSPLAFRPTHGQQVPLLQ